MINRYRYRSYASRRCVLLIIFIIGPLIITVYSSISWARKNDQYNENYIAEPDIKEKLTQWNRSLCSSKSDDHGPHQKIISISVYGSTSKFTNNPMYSWESSILPFLKPLADEINLLLPSWIIRIYIDFTGSTKLQREIIYSFSNIQVCDITNIPLFGSSLLTYLPAKMWRFLPVFDPFVDYMLSFDLDSPMIQRQTETINMWISNEHERKFFYIARDHKQHGVAILGGLWGAALVRARRTLHDIFSPMLIPSTARQYNGSGDQLFLSDFIYKKVKDHSLTFDSYYCKELGGQPFPTQRPTGDCYLGCIRGCCSNTINDEFARRRKPCPVACRPKDHQDWIYC